MKDKIFIVSLVPSKAKDTLRATVAFPDGWFRQISMLEASAKARQLALKLMQSTIAIDPELWRSCHMETRMTEVDLSQYATPNLLAGHGVRAWLTA
jgi:hypothetical protein